jgi:hypothetical protein
MNSEKSLLPRSQSDMCSTSNAVPIYKMLTLHILPLLARFNRHSTQVGMEADRCDKGYLVVTAGTTFYDEKFHIVPLDTV